MLVKKTMIIYHSEFIIWNETVTKKFDHVLKVRGREKFISIGIILFAWSETTV